MSMYAMRKDTPIWIICIDITLLNESKDHGLVQIKQMKQKFEGSIE